MYDVVDVRVPSPSLQAVDAAKGFNLRVTEGKLAAKLVAKKAGLADWAGIQTMLELQVCLKS